MKTPMIVLVALHTLYVAFIALTSSFADGGTLAARATLVGLHPIAAVALIVAVAFHPISKPLSTLIAIILVANIVGDIVISAMIISGAETGQWWLPLTFSIVPLIGIFYVMTARRQEA